MQVIAAAVLSADDLAEARAHLAGLSWTDGGRTAGPAARAVKRNEQADLTDRPGAALHAWLLSRIKAHPVFAAAAMPRRISRLMVSRTGPGGEYGSHTDNAIMGDAGGRLRTDLSFTLFLSAPEAFEGGDLVVEGALGDQRIKLPAGDLFLYPSGSIHRVEPVVAGERLVCVGWVESAIRDADAREILWDLERVRSSLPETTPAGVGLTLSKAIGALVRRWGEA